jgi:hypothetical protein
VSVRTFVARAFTLIELQVYLFLLFVLVMSVSSIVVRISKETGCAAIADTMQIKAHLLFDRIRRDLINEKVTFYVKNKKLLRRVKNSSTTVADKINSIDIKKNQNDTFVVKYELEGGKKQFVWYVRKMGVYKT